MTGRPYSEDARKLVHILFGAFALLLRVISWWEAALLAAAALAFNVLVMPRLGVPLYRPADHARRLASGIVLYPLAVLILVLVFRHRLDIAAAAWGILAVGDGASTMIGRRIGRRRIPWNREKSVEGSAALVILGGAAGAFLAWWCRAAIEPAPSLWFALAAPFVAALAAAFVETIPVRIDDNLSVPAAAAATLWMLSLVREDLVRDAAAAAAYTAVPAAALNAIAAWAGYRTGGVTRAGALAGATIGTIVAITTGWSGWMLLLATFLAATASSRMGLQRKTLLGIAEERHGRRGAGNAIANTGVAAAAALMSALTPAREPALLAFAAALAAGGSDTIASEIGKAWGRRTYRMPWLQPARPGTSGAISLEGTLAGLAGAALLAAIAIALGPLTWQALLPIVAAATVGSLVESVLGATLEDPGILNNDLLNFLNTVVAAGVVLLFAGVVR